MVKNAAWIDARNLINSGAQVDDIRGALSKLTKHRIENTYEDGQNLLRHAIAKNNLEMARFLFEKKYFLLPHLSETIPYLHVACFYGFKDMVDLLLEKRPNKEDVKVSADDEHWKRFIAANSLRVNEKDGFLAKINSFESENEQLSAYRVAALCLEEECLASLLKKFQQNFWLSHMVALGEPDSLEFLLNAEGFFVAGRKRHAVHEAFEMSLIQVSPQCLELVLKYANKHRICIAEPNPFFLLYTYGKFGLWTGMDPMAEMTRLLINYGWDVNAMREPASFPLYCVLRHVKDYDDEIFHEEAPDVYQTMDEALACLSELLAAGANPQFDEKLNGCRRCCIIIRSRLELVVNQEIGKERTAFSSVAEALVALIEADQCLWEFVSKAGSLMKKYGCHLSGQRCWLAKMIENDDDAGLEMLLKILEFDLNSINHGLEECLQRMAPDCLDSLLQYAAENSVTFSQKDPLSFMYLCAVCERSPAGKNFAECTRTLIRYGYSVKGMHAPASYPLYTLLWGVAAVHHPKKYHSDPGRVLEEAIACLDFLLAAGADPNFDEVDLEMPNSAIMPVSAMEASVIWQIQTSCMTDGQEWTRKPYSGATEVLMDMFDFLNSGPDFLRFVAQSATRLVKHECDLSFRNGDGQNVLHIFMKDAAAACDYYYAEVTEKQVYQHLGELLHCLVTGGADVNARDCSSELPLTCFGNWLARDFSYFVTCGESDDEELLEKLPPRMKPILRVLDVMGIEEAHEVVSKFMEVFDQSIIEDRVPDVNVNVAVVEHVKDKLQSRLEMRSLYHSCLIKLWCYCGYEIAKTEALGLPWIIKQHLNDMLNDMFSHF